MRRNMFYSKIHRAVVTHADLEYEGSVTIDVALMEAADILPNERVHIWNITRGSRLSTYALPGPEGSGIICVNGAAAHLNQVGDRVILATFVELEDAEARDHTPKVILVDDNNAIVDRRQEQPGPARPRLVATPEA